MLINILKKYHPTDIEKLKNPVRILENDLFGKYYSNIQRYK